MTAAPKRRGPSPRQAVWLELARALGGLALLPLRLADFLVCREALCKEFTDELRRDTAVAGPAAVDAPRNRPLRVFVSCAETSGEAHAVHLVEALRSRLEELGAPPPRLSGLGGEGLAAAGVSTVGDPVRRAAMGLDGMLGAVPYYMGLLRDAAACLREERPDVAVLVDSPALHVPLARIARRYGVTTVHFVTPQLWAWAPWRVGGYRAAVDRALSILPFEPDWFRHRGVDVVHVGHPRLDALREIPRSTGTFGKRVLAVLPGSRDAVIDRNLPWMLRIVARLRRDLPDLEVVVLHDEPRFGERFGRHVEAAGAGSWARVEVGDLHGSLARAGAAFTVSGTVLTDLLHHRLPTVVVYRLASRRDVWVSYRILSTPWFSSVNLVAGREVLPEFRVAGEGPVDEVLAALRRCFDDPAWARRVRDGLELVSRRLGPPGACGRAADQVLLAATNPPEDA